MRVRHVGLATRSLENADRFYGQLLGLRKSEPKTLPAAISRLLFNLDKDFTVVNYADDTLHFEIFVYNGDSRAFGPPGHVCLEAENLDALVERCRAMNFPVVRAPKGEGWITFIQDDDGNFFEIKELPAS